MAGALLGQYQEIDQQVVDKARNSDCSVPELNATFDNLFLNVASMLVKTRVCVAFGSLLLIMEILIIPILLLLKKVLGIDEGRDDPEQPYQDPNMIVDDEDPLE